jgi:hypothetical protein
MDLLEPLRHNPGLVLHDPALLVLLEGKHPTTREDFLIWRVRHFIPHVELKHH